MRKFISILLALLPLGYAVILFIPLSLGVDVGPFADALHISEDEAILSIYSLYLLLGLALCIAYSLGKRNDNLLVKLSALPVDIGILMYYICYWADTIEAGNSGAMEAGLGVFLLSLLLLPYLLLRIGMAISCSVTCARTLPNGKGLHPILQLVPIAGIVSAFIVHKKLYK